MRKLFLTDKEIKENLFPFSLVRSVADIRIGILTIREKWEAYLGQEISSLTDKETLPDHSIIFAGNIVPSKEFIASLEMEDKKKPVSPNYDLVKIIQYPWHIFKWNDWAIRNDFELLTSKRKSLQIPAGVQASNPSQIFIEAGAVLSYCTLNAHTGPIYIGKNAEIMEGAVIRGPFALCEGSTVKMGTKIYGATTIGPYSVVGGEIKNSVIFGYSNKAHDGYLGDAVIGEWCNLGAGTSNSNLKNTASDIKVWNPFSKEYIAAGLKCGLLMGDYSRCAINTSFNTGTVVGICSNIVGEGLTPKYIPSFTWGTKGFSKYEFEKALTNINNWKKLKNLEVTEEEIQHLKHIFEQS